MFTDNSGVGRVFYVKTHCAMTFDILRTFFVAITSIIFGTVS